jgi:uncharacterized protein YdeI (YjbR/CyaY-like superfamily)
MPATDPRIDAYIRQSAPFAQPILKHIRELVHKACPQAQETMKWSVPHFDYKGVMCAMAAFKEHCRFGFWKGSLLDKNKELVKVTGKSSMADLEKITSLKDLPSDKILIAVIKEAARLNEENIKITATAKPAKPTLETPDDLLAALKKNKKALKAFEEFSPSHRREYIEWITEAKTEATRNKRIQTTLEWLIQGKSRNWKYQK